MCNFICSHTQSPMAVLLQLHNKNGLSLPTQRTTVCLFDHLKSTKNMMREKIFTMTSSGHCLLKTHHSVCWCVCVCEQISVSVPDTIREGKTGKWQELHNFSNTAVLTCKLQSKCWHPHCPSFSSLHPFQKVTFNSLCATDKSSRALADWVSR